MCELLLITQIINFKNLKITWYRENTLKKYSFTKLFQPRKPEKNDKNIITFARTYNPNHQFWSIIPCSSFSFKLTNDKTITWTYKSHFSWDSKDVIYILICKTCDNFHLGQTQDFKQRTAKHKPDVKNLHNSTCRICSEHLRDCN